MSQFDEEFLQRLRAMFVVEASEHVQAISSGLLDMEKKPMAERDPAGVEAVFRHAHSLKGAARAAGFTAVETICQSLETVFAEWKRERIDLVSENFDTLHRAIDLIEKLIPAGNVPPGREDAQGMSLLLRQLGQLAAGEGAASEAPAAVRTSFAPATPEPAPVLETREAGETDDPRMAPRSASPGTIRVSTTKLDRLLLNAEEMLAVKQSVAQRAVELRQLEPLFTQWSARWSRLQPQFRELREAAATAPHSAQSGLAEFLDWNFGYIKSLEAKLRLMAKSAGLDRDEAGKRVDDLLTDSKELVMLPFSTLADLFPKLVRDLSRDQGKDIELAVRGGDVEMDKRILDEMKDALMHLVRNAIDHGIETPPERVRQGKTPRATLVLTAEPVDGSKVEIVVSDDGAGVDVARVKESAVKRGLITVAEAGSIEDRKACELIFQSEVSTSPIITEISGRGLGLAIVREKAAKLGGRVAVESPGTGGTIFRVTVPMTLATFRGILVRVGERIFAVPAAQVERVARVRTSEAMTVENRETISLNGRAFSLARLDEILELPPAVPQAGAAEFITIILLGSGDERVAFAVDEVLHEEEVLVKSLRRPLSRVRNIAGVTVLASGELALILNAVDLLKSARKAGGVKRAPAAPTPEPRGDRPARTVLVAEDSITSRMLLKGILESAGYRVKTAVDGMEAWTMLRTEDFDLVVSDIEMPRMNGFDLTAHIRADKKLADKPVVLVTALASQADREHGIDVGASAYLVKSSFDQSNLLDAIRRLV